MEHDRASLNPERDCNWCPRLTHYRSQLRASFPSWFNAPVPVYGDTAAPLWVVGLAPGKGGANRTGIPFCGDAAGEILYPALAQVQRASQDTAPRGGTPSHQFSPPVNVYRLHQCCIVNAVRCVPPKNLPSGSEINQCGHWLRQALLAATDLRCILALGGVAHRAVLSVFGVRASAARFVHAGRFQLGELLAAQGERGGSRRSSAGTRRGVDAAALRQLAATTTLVSSYHTSRYNINTRRLTADMFAEVVQVADDIARSAPAK